MTEPVTDLPVLQQLDALDIAEVHSDEEDAPVQESPEERDHESTGSEDETDDEEEYSEYSEDDRDEVAKDPELLEFDRSDNEDLDDDVDEGKEDVAMPDQSREPQRARAGYRYRPGTVAIREIRHYQKTTHLLIPRGNFNRLVRQVTLNTRPHSWHAHPFRFTKTALEALQEAAEDFLVTTFRETQTIAIHAGREVITDEDMRLVANRSTS